MNSSVKIRRQKENTERVDIELILERLNNEPLTLELMRTLEKNFKVKNGIMTSKRPFSVSLIKDKILNILSHIRRVDGSTMKKNNDEDNHLDLYETNFFTNLIANKPYTDDYKYRSSYFEKGEALIRWLDNLDFNKQNPNGRTMLEEAAYLEKPFLFENLARFIVNRGRYEGIHSSPFNTTSTLSLLKNIINQDNYNKYGNALRWLSQAKILSKDALEETFITLPNTERITMARYILNFNNSHH